MYKDKDKQREANKQASKKYRDSMTDKGMTVLPNVIPSSDIPVIPKRGKDIKVFADLSLDVKRTIVRLTTNQDGSIDYSARANRIAIAIDYQHKHPDRYHSTSAVFTGGMTVMERLFYRPGQLNFVSLPGRACHGVYQ